MFYIKRRFLSWMLLFSLLLIGGGCVPERSREATEICVTIAPLRSLVERIVGDDFRVKVLVSAGMSPETFDPTPRQLVALHEARLVVTVGLLDFERTYLARTADTVRTVALCRGIELIGDGPDGAPLPGCDPHVWLSPPELRQMAKNLYEALHRIAPDSAEYAANYRALDAELARLDAETRENLSRSGVRTFYIHHPALAYYARAYGLEQVAIEDGGREPSARRLARLIARARAEGATRLFYEKQFPISSVEALCSDIGAEAVAIDPLDADVVGNIRRITEQLVAP